MRTFVRSVWDEITGAAEDRRLVLMTLHKAAQRIREVAGDQPANLRPGMMAAADLIDPGAGS